MKRKLKNTTSHGDMGHCLTCVRRASLEVAWRRGTFLGSQVFLSFQVKLLMHASITFYSSLL